MSDVQCGTYDRDPAVIKAVQTAAKLSGSNRPSARSRSFPLTSSCVQLGTWIALHKMGHIISFPVTLLCSPVATKGFFAPSTEHCVANRSKCSLRFMFSRLPPSTNQDSVASDGVAKNSHGLGAHWKTSTDELRSSSGTEEYVL